MTKQTRNTEQQSPPVEFMNETTMARMEAYR